MRARLPCDELLSSLKDRSLPSNLRHWGWVRPVNLFRLSVAKLNFAPHLPPGLCTFMRLVQLSTNEVGLLGRGSTCYECRHIAGLLTQELTSVDGLGFNQFFY